MRRLVGAVIKANEIFDFINDKDSIDGYIIPKGTRFIVAYIGANVNDIKIIGRYD